MEERPDTFRPVDAAEAPPVEPIDALANAGDFPTLADQGGMQLPHRPEPALDVDPNVAMAGENEPMSEIDTIHRTLEVPPAHRGKTSPAGDPVGTMSGDAGRRLRS
ncbi:DUF2934 domain-containing protein [Ancylobacter defluvii]|uniref:Uncharacterized protein n=1 Tax=Ancylobacter defluvii TaxID=1282440 RepID=A0A9W6N9L6_9HYPH|nr:DUF2934 domain-containing protein [Ancylobacter defluvii]MBS7590101.1 DUF2934 domain-containing protein [Ancylobacter defluvii]GLK82723.1 hypothetical protein GCM10017653_07920 [Ancylobacter defluvii]